MLAGEGLGVFGVGVVVDAEGGGFADIDVDGWVGAEGEAEGALGEGVVEEAVGEVDIQGWDEMRGEEGKNGWGGGLEGEVGGLVLVCTVWGKG